MSLLAAVDKTLEALALGDDDAAAVELARVYARQLDQAAAVRASADKALQQAMREGDETLIEQLSALRAKLGERECVDRIGARLHALLAELQATPKARGGAKPPAKTGGTLHQLRAAR